MITDPPYGVGYDPGWRERAGLGVPRQTGAIANDHQADWTQAYRLFPGNVAYVWHAGVHAAEVARGLEEAGLRIRAQIIWAKQHFALSRGDYHWQHEPCWYCVRAGQCSNWCGDRTQSTLWEVPNLNPFGGNVGDSPVIDVQCTGECGNYTMSYGQLSDFPDFSEDPVRISLKWIKANF